MCTDLSCLCQLRKRRIKAELPVAAAIRLLERRGGQSDRACEMLDRWLNDVSYGQLSPPGSVIVGLFVTLLINLLKPAA